MYIQNICSIQDRFGTITFEKIEEKITASLPLFETVLTLS